MRSVFFRAVLTDLAKIRASSDASVEVARRYECASLRYSR